MAWSFRGQNFEIVAGEAIFEEWWKTTTLRTVDEVLTDGTVQRYVDIGAAKVEPMSFVMQFTDTTDRATMRAKLGLTGTLADGDGRSCTALLSDEQPIRVVSASSGYYRLAVTFEYVGA